jgi:16S rRNA (cytidine1402-2'-O)-methyltransferase
MLYVCATPIGNLNDITLRALAMLAKADIILCEDTRVSSKLLTHHGINHKRLIAVHEHNENEMSQKVINWLHEGLIIVQISDAGTPGISDPGARLCQAVRQAGFTPQPLPGACAFTTLLSVAGLSQTTYLFHGFLAAKASQRQKQLTSWQSVEYVIAIYESPHRILACLNDIVLILGGERQLVIGRELTKQFETILIGTASDLVAQITHDSNQQKGEFVILILPAAKANQPTELTPEIINALLVVAGELPAKKAVNLVAKLYGGNKDQMYQYLLEHK